MSELIHSSEAMALLSLAAKYSSFTHPPKSTAVGDDPLGTESYISRHVIGEHLTALVDKPFVYSVVACFGELGPDSKGRCVALIPEHQPHRIILTFAGVRPRGEGEEDCGPANDRRAAAMSHARCGVQWLPQKPFMEVHTGMLDYHSTIYDGPAGLGAWISSYALELECSRRHAQVPAAPGPAVELLLIGQSMGGALAEMTALRIALTHKELAPRSAPTAPTRLHRAPLCFLPTVLTTTPGTGPLLPDACACQLAWLTPHA